MAVMEWRSSREWIFPNDNEIKTELDPVFREYCQAAEAFAIGVIRPSSVYDLMVVKQRYLLAAAALLKRLSDIFAYGDIFLAASLFEAAAWAYLDNTDLQAQLRGQDSRFAPGEENFRLLRSRLKVIAERTNRLGGLCSREIMETSNIEISTLRFLLSLVLDLPMSAWECAPCIAVIGRCSECSYGQDHGICSLPGSTYDMLCRSREAILKSIRRRLTKGDRSSEDKRLRQEQNVHFDSTSRASSVQMDIDTCWELDVVEACD